MNRLTEHIGQLPKIADSKRLSEAERLMLDASTRLRLSEPELLTQVDSGSGHYEALDQLLAALETRLLQTSRVLTQDYFSHARSIQQLSSTHQELENEL
ncbi:MAG: alpha-E domain-containing protein [bacterium]|nr:alpha-E domain-containing protein [bacterium]